MPIGTKSPCSNQFIFFCLLISIFIAINQCNQPPLMDNYEHLMRPHLKRVGHRSINFELQPLDSIPIFYIEDDMDAPTVLRVDNPMCLQKSLELCALINYSSDFYVKVKDSPYLNFQRSASMEDHCTKIYKQMPISFTVSNDCISVFGLYARPQLIDSTADFQCVLMDGEICEEMWIYDIIAQYFAQFRFSYVLEITCKAFWNMSSMTEALIEACRKIVKSLLYDFKDIAGCDTETFNTLIEFNCNPVEKMDDSVIDIDDIPDEHDLENCDIVTICTDDREATCLPLIYTEDHQEMIITKIWFVQKWIEANKTYIIETQVVDDSDLRKILDYKPQNGTALQFWKPSVPDVQFVESVRRSSRLQSIPKPSYKEDDFNQSTINDLPVQRLSAPFNYKIPKKSEGPSLGPPRRLTMSQFDLLKNFDDNDNKTNAPFTDDGIILSSDDDDPSPKSKNKFFTNPALAKKRQEAKNTAISRKPQYSKPTRKLRTRAVLDSLDHNHKIESFFSPQRNGARNMNAIQDDMFLEIDAPSKKREQFTRKAKELARERNYGTTRGRAILDLALNDIKKQKENDIKEQFHRTRNDLCMNPMVMIPKLSYFDDDTQIVPSTPVNARQKDEINFDLMDED